MDNTIFTAQLAGEALASGLNCAQIVLKQSAEKWGFTEDVAMKSASAFGGGMGLGDCCGCVTGGLMALGFHFDTTIPEEKAKMMGAKAAFEKAFAEKHGSLVCREILGYDPSVPEESKILMELGLKKTICPKAISHACTLLDNMD